MFPDKWEIQEGGQRRSFDVAKDEISLRGRDGVPRTKKIAEQADADWLRKVAAGAGGDLVLYETGAPRDEAHRRYLTGKVVVKLPPGFDLSALVHKVGVTEVRRSNEPDMYILSAPQGSGDALLLAAKVQQVAGVGAVQPLLARQHQKKFIPNDPLFADNVANAGYQWHLRNVGSRGGTSGVDANVAGAWDLWRGRNVTLAIVDDGLQWAHPDLQQNYTASESFDFNEDDGDPSPGPADHHGTSCSGVAAARGNNGIGISGAAPEAKLAGLRLIAGPSSDDQDAEAFLYHEQSIAIKSNSWGPSDNAATISGPDILSRAAMQHATSFGRGGKGTVFVWAAGNGGSANDNSNFDGWANSPCVIAVAAINHFGSASWYSEQGANLLICAPSNHFSGDQGITTTDLLGASGYNPSFTANYADLDYTNDFGGTSSACPLISGVAALMLEANPTLTWRDVKEILVRTAVKNDSGSVTWVTNGAGFHFSHRYGAGLVDATAATTMAASWTNLPREETRTLTESALALAIPDNSPSGITRTLTVAAADDLRVEHLTLAVDITHTSRGQLTVDLTSPSGTVSHLATRRSGDFGDHLLWTFSSTQSWGESAVGNWTVQVADTVTGATGTLNSLTLTLRGAVSSPGVAPVVPASSTITGHAGAPLYAEIPARNGPVSFGSGALPTGLTLDASRGLITGSPTVAGEFDVSVSATNGLGTGVGSLHFSILDPLGVPLATALDAPSQTWATTEFRPWESVTDTTHDGVDAARSPSMGNLTASAFSTTVTGPQLVNFWWKVSSEADFDFLRLFVDDQEVAAISGEVDWTNVTAGIPSGSHEVRWEYRKDNFSIGGSDAAWVDQVAFSTAATAAPVFVRKPMSIASPDGSRSGFLAEAVGAAPLSYQWKKDGVPLSAPDDPFLILPVISASDAGNYTVTVTNGVGSATSPPVSLTVTSAASSATLAGAVGSSGMNWGSAPSAWFVQSATVDSAPTALRSGNIGDLSQSWLHSFVEGPANLTLRWNVSSEWNYDYGQFWIDGRKVAHISGEPFWQTQTVSLPAGPHILGWAYVKDVAEVGGTDAAYVDSVKFVPLRYASFAPTVFSAAQMLSLSVSGATSDPDADGIDNFAEYAFGSAPLTPNQAAAPVFGSTTVSGNGYLTISYHRRTDFAARGLTYTLLASEDSVAWTPADVIPVSVTTDGAMDTVTVRLTDPITAATPSRLLFRVAVAE